MMQLRIWQEIERRNFLGVDMQTSSRIAGRMQMLQQAEKILMSELPIIPIYFYVSTNLVKPRVKGFSGNIQDVHPLHILRVE